MTASELAKKLDLEVAAGMEGIEKEVGGCYIGDLLSLAMSKVEEKNIWVTIQTNVNVVAVMVLTDGGAVILCDGQMPDEQAKAKADSEGVPLLTTERSAYEVAKELASLGI